MVLVLFFYEEVAHRERLPLQYCRCWQRSTSIRGDDKAFGPDLCPDICSGRTGPGQFRYRSAPEISQRAPDQSLMLFGLFLTLGVAVLSVALRSFQSSFSQKAGAAGILASTYLAVYFIS